MNIGQDFLDIEKVNTVVYIGGGERELGQPVRLLPVLPGLRRGARQRLEVPLPLL